jgi:hypothetical protein
MGKLFDRRRFLCFAASAGAGFAAAGALAPGARALSLAPMPEGMKSAYLAACEAPSAHLRLLAEIEAQLAGRALSTEEVAAVKAASRCPICGCPLASAEPPAAGAGETPD